MTGRGIDQALSHPGDPTLFESYVKSAVDYLKLAERANGPIPRPVPPHYIWGDSLAVLAEESPDVRIVNLETAITDGGAPWPGKGIHYRMHPANVSSLTVAALDACTLANNHILDWSYEGVEQTLAVLAQAGILVVGAGRDRDSAHAPVVVDIGSDGRLVLLGMGTVSSGIPPAWAAGHDRPGVALLGALSDRSVDEVAEVVTAVAKPGDLVVFSIHWGPNWGYEIPRQHRRFAHRLIDGAGVHIVHGHSSHHPLGIEVHRGRLVLYGCGDLINDYEGIGGREEFRSDLGLLYLVTMERATGMLTRLELIPIRRRRFRLERASTEDATWLAGTLSREGARLATSVDVAPNGRLVVSWS